MAGATCRRIPQPPRLHATSTLTNTNKLPTLVPRLVVTTDTTNTHHYVCTLTQTSFLEMWGDMDAMSRGRGCICTLSSNICRFLFYWEFDRIARAQVEEGQGADADKGFVLRSLDEPKMADQCERFGLAKSRPDAYIGMI
jgi:hypothetical protein